MEEIIMSNELKMIHEQEVLGKQFKTYGSKENPLFLAKDVAEWIEYDESQASRLLKDVDVEEKVKRHRHTASGLKQAWFLTEDGLYEVLMQSQKPLAKQFKKEVKNILKRLRLNEGTG